MRYGRQTNIEDPWISITDHTAAVNTDDMLYGGNTYAASTVTANPSSSSSSSSASSSSSIELQREKRALHEMLKRYEREFEHLNGRPVRTIEDIAAVQGKYDRYKQLKLLLGE